MKEGSFQVIEDLLKVVSQIVIGSVTSPNEEVLCKLLGDAMVRKLSC